MESYLINLACENVISTLNFNQNSLFVMMFYLSQAVLTEIIYDDYVWYRTEN
jgi:hypothetical protein